MLESDDWSDDEQDGRNTEQTSKSLPAAATQDQLELIKAELASNSARLAQCQLRVQDLLDEMPSLTPTSAASAGRDDDSHYFESYGYQGKLFICGEIAQIPKGTRRELIPPEIHATMLRDTVRTMSYAKFILSNPEVFRDKLVMDVGCGTPFTGVFYCFWFIVQSFQVLEFYLCLRPALVQSTYLR